jgi:hypothetical protein
MDIATGAIPRVCLAQGLLNSSVSPALQNTTCTDHNATKMSVLAQLTPWTMTVESANYVNGAAKYVTVPTIAQSAREVSTYTKDGVISNVPKTHNPT